MTHGTFLLNLLSLQLCIPHLTCQCLHFQITYQCLILLLTTIPTCQCCPTPGLHITSNSPALEGGGHQHYRGLSHHEVNQKQQTNIQALALKIDPSSVTLKILVTHDYNFNFIPEHNKSYLQITKCIS